MIKNRVTVTRDKSSDILEVPHTSNISGDDAMTSGFGLVLVLFSVFACLRKFLNHVNILGPPIDWVVLPIFVVRNKTELTIQFDGWLVYRFDLAVVVVD